MGCSLFLDKMVEEPPAPKLQKPQQILACVFSICFLFFVDYLLKVWLLTLDASAVVICVVSSCEFWPGAHSAWGWGDRLPCQCQDGVVFFCIAHGSMVFQDWYDSVSRGLLSRHLLSTVEEFSDHSQVARRCEKWKLPPQTCQSQRGCNRHQSPQAMLKAQQELWGQTRSASEGTPKRSKSGWLGFGQGLHHVAFSRACTGSRRSRRCHEVSKVHVKPMWSPCEAL